MDRSRVLRPSVTLSGIALWGSFAFACNTQVNNGTPAGGGGAGTSSTAQGSATDMSTTQASASDSSTSYGSFTDASTATLASTSTATGMAVPCVPACANGSICWLGACTTIESIELGASRSCAITAQGALQCWGLAVTDLGNGNVGNSPIPVQTTGAEQGIAQVSVGTEHACAVTTAGAAVCWGANGSGAVGASSLTYYFVTPVGVTGLGAGVAAVSAEGGHSCAITTAGAALCWGRNNIGQLGDGTRDDRFAPVPVIGLSSGVVAIEVGDDGTCAILDDGAVRCWGYGFDGQLGDDHAEDWSAVPVDVIGIDDAVQLALGGQFACALLGTGKVKCWGGADFGEFGPGVTSSPVPIEIPNIPADIVSIRAGFYHTCALTSSEEVWCWGGNSEAQLGVSGWITPARVDALPPARAIGAGYAHSCALTTQGQIYCWGRNFDGQIGNGTQQQAPFPALVEEP